MNDWKHNRFFTHQPILRYFVENTTKPILELGSGEGSTLYLHQVSEKQKVMLTTLDNDQKWLARYTKLKGLYHNLHMLPNKCDGPTWVTAMRDLGLHNKQWGVVFVDQSPWEARVESINMFKAKADLIIVHDADYFPEHNMLGSLHQKVKQDVPGVYDFSNVFTQWKMYWPPSPWCSPTGPPTLVGTMRTDITLPTRIPCEFFTST